MVKQLTTEQKRDIIHKFNVEHQKAADIAKEYNKNTRSIYRIISGEISTVPSKRRPSIGDELTDEILRFVKENPSIRSHEISPHLSKPVANSTINRIIRESNFNCQGRQNPSRVYIPEPTNPMSTSTDHGDGEDICIVKKELEEEVIDQEEEEISSNEDRDDIKEEDEPQFYPDDESSGEDHVVNSILYMGKICNPDLTIRKV